MREVSSHHSEPVILHVGEVKLYFRRVKVSTGAHPSDICSTLLLGYHHSLVPIFCQHFQRLFDVCCTRRQAWQTELITWIQVTPVDQKLQNHGSQASSNIHNKKHSIERKKRRLIQNHWMTKLEKIKQNSVSPHLFNSHQNTELQEH